MTGNQHSGEPGEATAGHRDNPPVAESRRRGLLRPPPCPRESLQRLAGPGDDTRSHEDGDDVGGAVPSDPSPTDPTPSDPTPSDPTPEGPVDDLEFGPSGYLPPKASARARKIVLRAPLGIQWVVGAVVAGVVVVIAGLLWLSRSGPPEAPYEATIEVAAIDDVAHLDGRDALAVAAAGPVRVYVTSPEVTGDITWCPDSGRLEFASGVWSASSGRGFGVESLPRHPSEVHEDTLYVDFSTTIDGPAASSTPEQPTC